MATTFAELRRKSRQRRARPIQRVVQQTGTSCGVACVAMLGRMSFRDAFATGVALWDQEYWDKSHRTDAAELRAMLAELDDSLAKL